MANFTHLVIHTDHDGMSLATGTLDIISLEDTYETMRNNEKLANFS